MKIYNYKEDTKEYLNSIEAYEDPEASRRQGKFIPMMPANSTLLAPPDYDPQNQIPVFEDGQWVIKADYRKNFVKVNNNLYVESIKTIGEQEGYIVDKQTGQEINKNPNWFKIVNGSIVKKTQEEYDADEQEKEQQRINSLIVTRVELEIAIYKSYNITLNNIQEKLKGNLPENILVGITEMNIAFNANEFRRDNPYINLLCYILKISEQNMNQFFETKNFTCLKG